MLHFFEHSLICTRMEAQLVHAWLHKMYPRVFIEQEVLRVLTELNAIEITCIVCAHITTCDFHSSLNRAVPYLGITKGLVLLTCCFTDIIISRYTVLYKVMKVICLTLILYY